MLAADYKGVEVAYLKGGSDMAALNINKQVQEDIEKLKRDKGDEVAVSWLMQEFTWWQPVYVSRGNPSDAEAAKATSMQRAVFGLYQQVSEAIYNRTIGDDGQPVKVDEGRPALTVAPQDIPRQFDLNEVVVKFGGAKARKRGDQRQPDYVIKIDDEFALFTQSLSSVYGGPKPRKGQVQAKEPSKPFQQLRESLNAAIATKNAAGATKEELREALERFIEDYLAYAERLRSLPRPDAE